MAAYIDKEVRGIVFKVFGRTNILYEKREVPIAEVAQFNAENPTAEVNRVVWKTGTWSYAKAWFTGSQVVRIGAGANGDLVVWSA